MSKSDTKRISRLTAIITQLQTKRLSTAPELALKFSVSVRTIYRDIKTLEQSGIPIYVEDGRGFRLMEDFRLPPVMLTEDETNALIVVQQLVMIKGDSSLIRDYSAAVDKITSILTRNIKDKANLLSARTQFDKIKTKAQKSSNLSTLQFALTNFLVTKIDYIDQANRATSRSVEPFALLSTQESWLLVAWCRLRKGFRFFRLDRIGRIEVLSDHFAPHDMTLQEYFDRFH